MTEEETYWVPENLSKLKKVLGNEPCIYGLPMFHTYYSTPRVYDGISNRLSEKTSREDRITNAFRIIAGTTWNWVMSFIAGLDFTTEQLNRTITAKLCIYANIKSDERTSWKWNEIIGVKEKDPLYLTVLKLRKDFMKLKGKDSKESWTKVCAYIDEKGISQYAIQKECMTIYTPIQTQYEYRKNWGSKAFAAFIEQCEGPLKVRFDATIDHLAWTAANGESNLRDLSWLSTKQIQRYLRKSNVTNSKSKFKRKAK